MTDYTTPGVRAYGEVLRDEAASMLTFADLLDEARKEAINDDEHDEAAELAMQAKAFRQVARDLTATASDADADWWTVINPDRLDSDGKVAYAMLLKHSLITTDADLIDPHHATCGSVTCGNTTVYTNPNTTREHSDETLESKHDHSHSDYVSDINDDPASPDALNLNGRDAHADADAGSDALPEGERACSGG